MQSRQITPLQVGTGIQPASAQVKGAGLQGITQAASTISSPCVLLPCALPAAPTSLEQGEGEH